MRIFTSAADPASYSSTSFAIIQPTTGTSPTADAPTDTLTLTSSDGSVVITGNATTDTLDFTLGASFLAEAAQDAVGTIMTDSSEIDFTYEDSTPSITAVLKTTAVGAGSYGNASAVGTFTVDSKGRLTNASNTNILIASTAVSDFAEAAQDAVGGILLSSSTVTLTYSDITPSITAEVIMGAIDHGSLAGLGDDDHTQYHTDARALTWLGTRSTADLPEGSNLYYTDERAQDAVGAMVDSTLVYTDGTPLLSRAALTGDASASAGSNTITLATVNANVGTFGSATQSSVITVNAKGLITAASNTTVTPAVGSITGLGTGVATWLATPSSANLAAAITDETGTGALVFANTPTLVTPILGAATGTSLTLSSLTAGRVTFAGASGLLTDDADMTFSTNTLTVTNVVGSSELRMGDGLVNNPSLAFDSDTDTGWYRVGANQLGISAAGVQSAQFEELHVSSGSAQGWRLRNLTATATIPTLVPNQSDTNTGVGWSGTDEVAMIAGGVQKAQFGDNNWIAANLAIGFDQPSTVLDIASEIAQASTRFIQLSYHADSTAASLFNFRKSRGTRASPTGVLAGDVISTFQSQGHDGTSTYLTGTNIRSVVTTDWTTTGAATALTFGTASTSTTTPSERMRIDASGNIGIGTTSPTIRVDIKVSEDANTILRVTNTSASGTASAGVVGSASDSASMNFQSHGSARVISRFGQTLAGWNEFLAVTGNGLIIGPNADKPFILGQNATQSMILGSSGNVRIGTGNTWGTSAGKVLAIENGTAPTTSPADMIQLYSVDISAGNASLGLRTETAVTAAAAGASDAYLNIKVNGTTYKLLLHT